MKIIENTIPSSTHIYPFHQDTETIAFFDIETTGLSPRSSSIYLIGVMYHESKTGTWHLRQWFADDYRSEPEILKHFLTFLENYRVLYHFNGFTFDIPYVIAKCEKYHISIPENTNKLFQNKAGYSQKDTDQGISIDILKEIRPLKKKLALSKANQTALEKWLGIHRTDQYSGGDLIPVFSQYMQNRITQPERAKEQETLLLLHNHDDIAGMLEVCHFFAYLDALAPTFLQTATPSNLLNQTSFSDCLTPLKHSLSDGWLLITYPLPAMVPKPVQLTHSFPNETKYSALPPASLSLQENIGKLALPVFQGTLKFFFSPAKDYFYLPLEDTAIHKSVAQFVEPAYRQKATAATCYTKKTGVFYPVLNPKPHSSSHKTPFFSFGYKELPAFHELSSEPEEEQTKQWQVYLTNELPFF